MAIDGWWAFYMCSPRVGLGGKVDILGTMKVTYLGNYSGLGTSALSKPLNRQFEGNRGIYL